MRRPSWTGWPSCKLLEQYRDRDGLDWDDAKLHLIDLQYSDVRPEKGLYHRLVAAGRIERLLDDADGRAPRCTTRRRTPGPTSAAGAWRSTPTHVAAASWDSVIFDLPGRESLQRVPTIDPLRGSTRPRRARCSTAVTPPRRLFAALTGSSGVRPTG